MSWFKRQPVIMDRYEVFFVTKTMDGIVLRRDSVGKYWVQRNQQVESAILAQTIRQLDKSENECLETRFIETTEK